MPPRIFMTAGEASADKHAASLILAIREILPQAEFFGMGGPEMVKAGFHAFYDMHELSVMGFSEVVPRLKHIISVFRNLRLHMLRERCDVFIPIDLPDFNMPLARFAHKRGIKTLYYIAPQAWAWRSKRANTLSTITDGLAVIFPFEEPFFAKHDVNVRYVGHPYVEHNPPLFETHWPPKRVALMPGSRVGDINRMLSAMLGAKRIISGKYPDTTWFLPVAPGIDKSFLEKLVDSDINLCESLPEVDLAIVKSGTSSFELGLAGVPSVICYRTSALNYYLARTFVQIEHIGMPNIIAGKTLMPELIQEECNEKNLASSLVQYMDDEELYRTTRDGLLSVRASLGEKRASYEVAQWVKSLL